MRKLIAVTVFALFATVANGSIGTLATMRGDSATTIRITPREGGRATLSTAHFFDMVGDTCNNKGLKRGFKGLLMVGSQMNPDKNWKGVFKLDVIVGYQVNSIFSIGLGFGYRRYSDNMEISPVFLDLRVTFLETKLSPYFSAGFGYTPDLNIDLHGAGVFLSASVGVSYRISKRTAIVLGVGYERQGVNHIYYYSSNQDTFGISLGVSF